MRILVAGALGEVGRTVSSALEAMGHAVVRTSARGPFVDRPDVVDLQTAAGLIRSGRVDLLVGAAGRGDRRATERTGNDATEMLAPAAASAGIPAVLLSTTRVLEGYERDVPEDADALARTPYAEANALNEAEWLSTAGSAASVPRITNYFCAPSSADSPQALLLPWALVTQGLAERVIAVRSGPRTSREFVCAKDVARGVLLLAERQPDSRVCATSPGFVATLEDLVGAVQWAFGRLGLAVPAATFGPDSAPGPSCRGGWLASQGWSTELTIDGLTGVVAEWTGDRETAT